eukprot:TRINITY_DN6430_c0_g1_i1.p1 TRINITY_DN6430_c0_g1~~TRINITY_DN6430_c0_g1_i1.p1  ORF type:complete len:372 (-),score=93.66 TRINITY_DN6430_c0_g1_i1:20-1057(-)
MATEVTCPIQGNDVPITWDANLTQSDVIKVIETFAPFGHWVRNMQDKSTQAELRVVSVHMQSVDKFGPRIGFVKFSAKVADVHNPTRIVPGIVFARGGAVAVLMILSARKPNGQIKEYTVVTEQARIAAGKANFVEIPAGMLDGDGNFAGAMAREVEEELGLKINVKELEPLTDHFQDTCSAEGMYPSVGGCDEFIKIYLYRKEVDQKDMDDLEGKQGGKEEEGEKLTARVIPLDELWRKAPDAKALSALCLYREQYLNTNTTTSSSTTSELDGLRQIAGLEAKLVSLEKQINDTKTVNIHKKSTIQFSFVTNLALALLIVLIGIHFLCSLDIRSPVVFETTKFE